MTEQPRRSRAQWQRSITRVGIVSMSLAILVALIPTSARSQSPSSELREGTWVGESIVSAFLVGSTPDGDASWAGALESRFILDVSDGLVTGDWELSGNAGMRIQTSESIYTALIYEGEGVFEDLQNVSIGPGRELEMAGAISTSGTATTSQGTFSVGTHESTFQSSVLIETADCYELSADWTLGLGQLALEAGWSAGTMDGSFQAAFAVDPLKDEAVRLIEELRIDTAAWADEVFDTGVVDRYEVIDLIVRGRAISLFLADGINDCARAELDDPERYLAQFTFGIVEGLLRLLYSREVNASDLVNIVVTLGPLGRSDITAIVGSEVQKQTQRIVDNGMSATGEGCSPCAHVGGEAEVIMAAVAGKILGQDFDIDGTTFSADQVLEAANSLSSSP